MFPAWPLANRIELAEILPFLSHGTIVGVYDDGSWVDWDGEPADCIVMLSSYDLLRRPAPDPGRYHCIVHRSQRGFAIARLRGALDSLLGGSRGLALVTPRIGLLLAAAQRILGPARDRQSSVSRLRAGTSSVVRSSGGWVLPATRPWQLIVPTEIARSAVLSVRVANTVGAGRLLASWQSVRLSEDLVHVSLDGGSPEEVLDRLKSGGIRVVASRVWYPSLQTSPLENGAIPH